MAEHKVLERFATMTVNHLYGIDEKGRYATVKDYLRVRGFALTADLLAEGFKPADIEAVVDSGDVGVAHWPVGEPKTDLYWANDEATLRKMDEFAEQAVGFCYGQTMNQPAGGNVVTVGAEMESQERALVGLIRARERGRLREIQQLDQGAGPLYVTRGSFSDRMFATVFPESEQPPDTG